MPINFPFSFATLLIMMMMMIMTTMTVMRKCEGGLNMCLTLRA